MAGSKSNTYKPQPYSVKGKTAIVTGAGSGTYTFISSHLHPPHHSKLILTTHQGINFSFASLLLSKGCNVLIADLSLRPEAQALLTQYPDSPKAIFHATDVTDWTQLEAAFTAALTHFPSIDILCPGAGIYDPAFSNFWHPPGTSLSRDSPTGNGYTTLDINITHPIRATQLAIAHFLNHAPAVSVQNPKRVLIISSIAGQNSNLHTPLYVAAKHAMNGFVRSFEALEARVGIRVNAVAPGVIKTPLWTEHPEKMRFIDEGKDEWATPEEVAVAMLRCLEDEDLVGGTILEVGKGQTRLVEALVSSFVRFVVGLKTRADVMV
jgi:NAD(P)-dependent dehydrogenase (short-subunit alcohol dehydrogenase family)